MAESLAQVSSLGMISVPKEIEDKEKKFKDFKAEFLDVADYIISYAHEPHYVTLARKFPRSQRLKIDFEELQQRLREAFFERLYVHRPEIIEVYTFESRESIHFLLGPKGAGKTTLILKILQELKEDLNYILIYEDFDVDAVEFDSIPIESQNELFIKRLSQRIFQKFKDIIKSTGLINKWRIFEILNHPDYVGVREEIQISDNPTTIKEWEKALRVEENVAKLRKAQVDAVTLPSLAIDFLKKETGKKTFFLLDNCDRLQFRMQMVFSRYALWLSDLESANVVVALRSATFEDIKRTTDRAYGSIGKLVSVTKINRLKTLAFSETYEKDLLEQAREVKLDTVVAPTLEELLKKRLNFLADSVKINENSHEGIVSLEGFFRLYKKNESGSEYVTFVKEFFAALNSITAGVVSEDIFDKCNHNIRELLSFYLKFITKTILCPEPTYSIENFLGPIKDNTITILRTYFYKYITCRGKIKPESDAILNIFNRGQSIIKMLDLKILTSIYNWKRVFGFRTPKFKKIFRMFQCFGVKRDDLMTRLGQLSRDGDDPDLGFLYLDTPNGSDPNELNDETLIELMPAGEFFLKRLSLSREYIFWQSLRTPLEKKVLPKTYSINETVDDNLKLYTIWSFSKQFLSKWLQEEIELLIPQVSGTCGLDSPAKLYREMFFLEGKSYLENLIETILGTIKYTNLNSTAREQFHRKFENLLADVKRVVRRIN